MSIFAALCAARSFSRRPILSSSATRKYMRLWQYYRRLYYKALRDERETARVDRKVARLAGIGWPDRR